MAKFVLDACVAVSWCFPGDPAEDTPYSRRVLELLATEDAIVPEIWAYEVANSIFVSFKKRNRITERQIELERLRALPIALEPSGLWQNLALEARSREWNLTPYDAAYLDLALRESVPLATIDAELEKAALAEGVRVLTK